MSKSRSRASEVPKIALSKSISSAIYMELANDHRFLNYSTVSKLRYGRIFDICTSSVSRDLELGGVPVVSPSTKKVFFPISVKFGM